MYKRQTLYQVNGQFQVGEEIFINGVTASRSITEVEDYGMEDVKQLVGNDPTNYKFSADAILGLGHLLAPIATQYTISAKSGAASTITSPSANFANIGIKTGDIIQYSVSGNTVPTFNSVTAKTSTSISLEAISDVTNVCSGAVIIVSSFVDGGSLSFSIGACFTYYKNPKIFVSSPSSVSPRYAK